MPEGAEHYNPTEHFQRVSQNYERLTGGCTRLVARHLAEISPSVDTASKILDNACGPGVATEELIKAQSISKKGQIQAVDHTVSMIDLFNQKIAHEGWEMVETGVMPAEKLEFPDQSFTHSFTNFGIMFFDDPVKGASEIYRTLKIGGTAYVTTWYDLGYFKLVLEAQKRVRPDQAPFKPLFPLEWYNALQLENVLRQGGFTDISIYQHETRMTGESVEALAVALEERFYAITSTWMEEDRNKLVSAIKDVFTIDEEVATLDSESGKASVKMIANIGIAKK